MWPIPVLGVLGGALLSFASIALDDGELIPRSLTGDAVTALQILSTIALAMLTLTGLVLTMVLVVVQLAMGQFSPRIVRAVSHDRPSQLAIGVFVATFTHAMLSMRGIESTTPEAPVPGLAVVVGFVLVLTSIIVLILYIHHIGQSLRSGALIEIVGDETREVIDKLYPGREDDGDPGEPNEIASRTSGVLFHVNEERLVELASSADCTIEVLPAIGQFVPAGTPLMRVTGSSDALDRDRALRAIALGPERTMNEDLGYGFRMLVEIAERALSNPFEDPTTAIQAIDRLHDCLRRLATRPFPSGVVRDEQGQVRLITYVTDWDEYVGLAFDEIRQAGIESPQIPPRLKAAVEDLLTVASPERRPALKRQLRLLERDAPRPTDGGGDGHKPPLASKEAIAEARVGNEER